MDRTQLGRLDSVRHDYAPGLEPSFWERLHERFLAFAATDQAFYMSFGLVALLVVWFISKLRADRRRRRAGAVLVARAEPVDLAALRRARMGGPNAPRP